MSLLTGQAWTRCRTNGVHYHPCPLPSLFHHPDLHIHGRRRLHSTSPALVSSAVDSIRYLLRSPPLHPMPSPLLYIKPHAFFSPTHRTLLTSASSSALRYLSFVFFSLITGFKEKKLKSKRGEEVGTVARAIVCCVLRYEGGVLSFTSPNCPPFPLHLSFLLPLWPPTAYGDSLLCALFMLVY